MKIKLIIALAILSPYAFAIDVCKQFCNKPPKLNMTQAQMWNNCGIWSTYFYPINGLKWPANSKINDSYRCGKTVNPYNCPSFKSLTIVTVSFFDSAKS
ncbi:hypothetical protein WR25_04866 [Diploscapter pachys]|uniref:Uncharacterized protein n=1 Tax=Diploscapter pachys TaxID=2018661 RepID=A0A2A2LXY1_9BILA|nr:hypothetical protein WR25_04866 [Diploscapter pachys]